MKKIPLLSGGYALVDDEDYESVSKYNWSCKFTGYNNIAIRGAHPRIALHNYLMNPPKRKIVDHINGNGLDNQRKNLRLATHADNARNKAMSSNNTSGYKGVVWSKSDRCWKARITVDYKRLYLGNYKNVVDAAKAYNEAAREHFGEFAQLNKGV